MARLNDDQAQAAKAKSSVRVTANTNAAIAAGARIWAVVLSAGSDASAVAIYNAATVTGTAVLNLTALAAGTSPVLNIPGGMIFDVGVSVGMTGTGAIATIIYTNG